MCHPFSVAKNYIRTVIGGIAIHCGIFAPSSPKCFVEKFFKLGIQGQIVSN